MHQQVWGYKVEDKLYLGVREQKSLNTTFLSHGTLIYLTVINFTETNIFLMSVVT
jgi:hypothetical protein